MKVAEIICVACVLLAVSVTAGACGQSEAFTSTQGGPRIALVLDEKRVTATPTWNPVNGDPPLSVAKATAIALAWGKERSKGFDSASIREVTLTAFACGAHENFWYYRIDFVPIRGGVKKFELGSSVAVLLDGSLVRPRETQVSPNKSLERTRGR
jgi:hypothetical protein